MKYSTVIFDLDGTLTDTLEDLTCAVNYALRQFGYPERTAGEVRSFVGNGALRLIQQSVPAGTDEDTVQKVLSVYTGYYNNHALDMTAPYDGIPSLLERLKKEGIKTAVVSNKPHEATASIVCHFFPGLVSVAIGQSAGVRRKPAPDGVLKVMEILGSDKEETIYVGDSDVDCMTAENAGIPVIGVSWGFRDRKVLEDGGADYIADTPAEVLNIIIKE